MSHVEALVSGLVQLISMALYTTNFVLVVAITELSECLLQPTERKIMKER